MDESLSTFVGGKTATGFESRPYYCPDGDFLTFHTSGEPSYAAQADSLLTVYRCIETDKVVGWKINHISKLMMMSVWKSSG